MVQSSAEKLVQFVACQLVDNPGDVRTRLEPLDDGVKVVLSVAESDRGKVIGIGGRTARALRSVIKAAGAVRDERFQLEIADL